MAAPLGNKYAVGNNGGRPRKFDKVEQLEEMIETYFESCFGVDSEDNRIQIRPITLEGLAYDLGCDRRTIWNYKGMKDSNNHEYFPAIKKAIDRCNVSLIEYALTAKNPAGAIWLACNNHEYTQKVEVHTTTTSDQLTNDDIQDKINELKKRQNKDESIGTGESQEWNGMGLREIRFSCNVHDWLASKAGR